MAHKDIIIGDDVWVARGVKLLSGANLAQGCIVAAYSVVAKSYPSYSVIAGSSGVIKSRRFSDEVCDVLDEINLDKIDADFISKYIDKLEADITLDAAKELRDLINGWK